MAKDDPTIREQQLHAAAKFRLQRKQHWPFAAFALWALLFATYCLLVGSGSFLIRRNYNRALAQFKTDAKPPPLTCKNALALNNAAYKRSRTFTGVTGLVVNSKAARDAHQKWLNTCKGDAWKFHSTKFREWRHALLTHDLWSDVHSVDRFDWASPQLYTAGSPLDKWLTENKEYFRLIRVAARTESVVNEYRGVRRESFSRRPLLLRAETKWRLAHGEREAAAEFVELCSSLALSARKCRGIQGGMDALAFEEEVSWFLSTLCAGDVALLKADDLQAIRRQIMALDGWDSGMQKRYDAEWAYCDALMLDHHDLQSTEQMSPILQASFAFYFLDRNKLSIEREIGSDRWLYDRSRGLRRTRKGRFARIFGGVNFPEHYTCWTVTAHLWELERKVVHLDVCRTMNLIAVESLLLHMKTGKWPDSLSEIESPELATMMGRIPAKPKLKSVADSLWIRSPGEMYGEHGFAYILPSPKLEDRP